MTNHASACLSWAVGVAPHGPRFHGMLGAHGPMALAHHSTRDLLLKELYQFSVLSFDCYGTLIDWEAGISAALGPLVKRAAALNSLPSSQDEILEIYARHEADQEHQTPNLPYSQLLAKVFQRLAAQWRVPVAEHEAVRFGESVGEWPAFDDTVEALRELKRYFRLVILSNVDQKSFAKTLPRLGVSFDAVYTAEQIGSYKPALANFEYLLAHLASDFGYQRGDLLHVAQSLFHDHAPANQLGIASAFIDRRHAKGGFGATPAPQSMPRIDFRFDSMKAFADAYRASRLDGRDPK
jgi:2-haloalkanoic acid dehalogenase type II